MTSSFHFIRRITCALLLINICIAHAFAATSHNVSIHPNNTPQAKLKAADDAFLEDLSRRSFQFFIEHANPQTGLVADRARTDGTSFKSGDNHYRIASSAATGFGLTALCIAAERGWMTREAARERVRVTLDFYANKSPHERGWFYHFVDMETGERRWRSEISSIDTSLLLGGVLTARGYFANDAEIMRLATKIYERVDFPWMLANHKSLLSHGWHPETGFIKNRWEDYSEQMMLLLLAIGSPTHPITERAWRAWARQRMTYAGYTYMNAHAPLFIHQFSHAWVDFRGRAETWYPFTDYFDNSVKATRAHRAFCLDLTGEFPGYSENMWGFTASDSALGYVAWGAPPRHAAIDGSIAPCAAAGSLMFAPDITVPALREMHTRFGERIYGRYGFTDAFHPTNGWTNPDVIGIDLGITILSAENLRTGNVWRWFMRNKEIPRAMDAVGLRRTTRPRRNRRASPR